MKRTATALSVAIALWPAVAGAVLPASVPIVVTTRAALPATGTTNRPYFVVDCESATTCAIGGGGNALWVAWNGSAYAVVASGGGGGGGAPASHASTHEDGGDDEIDVTGLAGLLATPQTPAAHTQAAGTISDSTAAGRALLTAATAAAQRTALGLGTAAVVNVPASGDAAAGEVVNGSDTRLTDARMPTSTLVHASTHVSGGGDALSGTLAVDVTGNAATSTTAAGLSCSTCVDATDLAPRAVTFPKLPAIATSRLLGRFSAGSGDVEEITLGAGLSLSGGGTLSATGGSGDVVGPSNSLDNEIPRHDGTTGKLLQGSSLTLSDLASSAVTYSIASPVATTGASQAGRSINQTASAATASTDTNGAAAGGGFVFTSGAAARRTSGDANGGDFVFVGGAGIGSGRAGYLRTDTIAAWTNGGAPMRITGSPYPDAVNKNLVIDGGLGKDLWLGAGYNVIMGIKQGAQVIFARDHSVGWSTSAACNYPAVCATDVGLAYADTTLWRLSAGVLGLRAAGISDGAAISLVEQTAPAAPATNGGYFFLQDNGSGKTQACVRFATGAAQCYATEP